MKNNIIESISERGNGEIYLGVVGAVRTGKSTFIKKVIENLVVPNIENEIEKKRCLDEIPQSAGGKTIMTTEPKFVPSGGATIKVDEFTTKIKLVDCVGYVIPNCNGYEDQNGNPRMVKTPWFEEEIPFREAAEVGTTKVIKDHSTIGIVITTDGSFSDLKREDYVEAENKVITELKSINKPFIVIVNTTHPNADLTRNITEELKTKYDVPVLPLNIASMTTTEINQILREALYEFEVSKISILVPEWVHVLNNDHYVKQEYIEKIKTSTINVNKLKDVDKILDYYKDSKYITKAYISNLDSGKGIVDISLDTNDEIYNQVLNELMETKLSSKASMIKVFSSYKDNKEETEILKKAIKEAKQTGYGIVYPTLKDMELQTPEVLKQGSRYGVKLKATASSYHIIRADVISSFEPIIGSELQSKELINYLMKDYETDKTNIWKSEIFGRSLDNIVKEGIQSKLMIIPENTKYKLSQTVTKIVNKGSNNLIAIVL